MTRAEVDVGGPLVPQCHLINAKDLDISDPLLPWQRKMAKRYEIGNAHSEFIATPDHYFNLKH